jgi:hypothetical protein
LGKGLNLLAVKISWLNFGKSWKTIGLSGDTAGDNKVISVISFGKLINLFEEFISIGFLNLI